MTDIFMSYARGDRDRIEPLVSSLVDRGWSIFWDRQIPTGQTWRSYIGAALNDAGCVIVAWSKESIVSEWVSEEADDAKQRGVLVPVLLDEVSPPIGFRSIQAADLSGWEPGRDSPLFDQLLRDIEAVLGSERPRPERRDQLAATSPGRSLTRPLVRISIALAVALIIYLSFLVLRLTSSRDGPPVAEMSPASPEKETKGIPQILEQGGPEKVPPVPESEPVTSKYWLKLGVLTCESVSGFWKKGVDQPYVVVNGERKWGPHDVQCPSSVEIDRPPIELGGENVTIELWESDATQSYYHEDDSLGKVELSRRVGTDKQPFLEGGARYFLTWEIVQE